ncbi:MAG: hypothetical protein A2087_10670 [Spirochaetes bacterium GWD1_61_31]|nr:MAG: hypothetical protein A2Y37_00200 [Spirochaetes bacterium GWB1_60_80]OHD32131.1 MAG: hypothetical protein A2004_05005 [Spirochaetes bacterium GWC1_61_12]OHD37134.1 MAG: hypothetical protein A2087_10670 [Spirochaetes bacterium GWD1_61_31]OHD42650.1 MAG: hypothetical protein A2Y35_12095 [Spirochaetes bacterium GWE1_60_18]OHD58531.1 MAG: hypothetical protein A2Y32_08675 [Spirochaetes bacterium GWF1_60_12]HAP43965.1 hypothetical protein [Spirochaetaceae bacterium]
MVGPFGWWRWAGRLAGGLLAALCCATLCAAYFFGLLFAWGLVVAPLVKLSGAGFCLLLLMALAAGLTILTWRRLHAFARRWRPKKTRQPAANASFPIQ